MARVSLIVYIEPEDKAKLEARAKDEGSSASRVARRLLEAALSDPGGKG